jgi:predicted phosphodiesterase
MERPDGFPLPAPAPGCYRRRAMWSVPFVRGKSHRDGEGGTGARRIRLWPWLGLGIAAALGLALAAEVLPDVRIRMAGLIRMDPPARPSVIGLDGHTLSLLGGVVTRAASAALDLRAWTPTPTLRVIEPAGPGSVTVSISNVPVRARLIASGAVDEARDATTRRLRFAPALTGRIAFELPGRELTFAVLGDTGDSTTFQKALRLAAADGADFLIHAGDLVYWDVQMPNIAWILAQSPLPVYVVRGNHDYRNRARIDFMRALGPPYYEFRAAGATFLLLDNGGSYLPAVWRRSTQYRWLAGALGTPRDGPLFVAMHKQPFDLRTGPRHSPMEDRGFAEQLMRDFAGAGVDAVFTGHAHASHLWTRDGVRYVISGEGMETPDGRMDTHQMAWVRVRGAEVSVRHRPIWRPDAR